MSSPTRIAKLLMDRVAENEGSHHGETRSNPREQAIINSFLKIIDDVCNSTSYQIESNTTLDYDNEEQYGDFEDEDTDSADESIDPGFDESAEGDNMMIHAKFNLEFMKKVIDYYDARDQKGRKKHTWKSTQHRLKSITHREYIARFRHCIEQHGTKREKLQIIRGVPTG
ncbi:unnamed protein product, partial [Rotaria magnacalcarata]